MIRWRIFETDHKERFLVGHCPEEGPGRISTALVSIDIKTGQCVSSSGRHYKLVGPPGYDEDGQYIWDMWAQANEVAHYDDVTNALIQD
ncbi:MAG: hypothetical protein ACLPXB_07585 [Thiobacillaceae bacterium]